MSLSSRPLQLPQPANQRFAGVGVWANSAVHFVKSNLYDKGEGVRYAVEQTVGYTVPRFVQQLNRTRDITGKQNKMAGYEMLARDLAADFTDTFLPGLLATFGIGKLVDMLTKGLTLVRHNIAPEALTFYEYLAGGATNKAAFYSALEQQLNHAAGGGASKPLGIQALLDKPVMVDGTWRARFKNWGWQSWANRMAQKPDITEMAHRIAQKLGLSRMDVRLTPQGSTAVEMRLVDLVRDLHILNTEPKVQWGQPLLKLLQKTRQLSRWQIAANVLALAASISIPFGIRLMTKRIYGHDAFPGTKEIHDHFHGEKSPHAAKKHHRGFEWFPYLKETLQKGEYWPTILTAGFFAVLGGAVARRFVQASVTPWSWKGMLQVYKFDRHFPFTTIAQMELTYGLLCGIRMAASRDQAEFRESTIRDCILGWPTLTYFFPWFRKILSRGLGGWNQQAQNALLKPMLSNARKFELRAAEETTDALLQNAALKQKPLLQNVKTRQDWVTILSALTSWFLLAYSEPKLGIWLTNRFELKKLAQQKSQAQQAQRLHQPEHQNPLPQNRPSQSVEMTHNGSNVQWPWGSVVPVNANPVQIRQNHMWAQSPLWQVPQAYQQVYA